MAQVPRPYFVTAVALEAPPACQYEFTFLCVPPAIDELLQPFSAYCSTSVLNNQVFQDAFVKEVCFPGKNLK
jgi:hypothetical protein